MVGHGVGCEDIAEGGEVLVVNAEGLQGYLVPDGFDGGGVLECRWWEGGGEGEEGDGSGAEGR